MTLALIILILAALMLAASQITRDIGSNTLDSPLGDFLAVIPIALYDLCLYGPIPCVIGWAVSAMSHNMGHTNIYHMGAEADLPVTRLNGIDKLLVKITKSPIRSARYCWLGMSIKGTCIGLPLFPFTPIVTIAYPTAYYLSFVTFKKTSVLAEKLVGPIIVATTAIAFIYHALT